MLAPAYRLTIGRKVVDTTDEPRASTVVDLTVVRDMETPADSVTLVLGNADGVKPARDDEIKVALGYQDDTRLTQVLAGTIATVEAGLTLTRVVGHAAAAALLRTSLDQTFEAKSAGAIVREMAGKASVEVAAAEDGITFPGYVVDGRRSVYHHMQDLAEFCGFDLYVDPDGKLVFEKFAGGKTLHTFEFGKHILRLDVQRTPARAGAVEAWGESPVGAQGDEAWPWLIKDFAGTRGRAGSGSVRLLERPALRTNKAAQTAADAALATIQRRTRRGQLHATGHPEVKLGDAIRVRGAPTDDLNTTFQVRSITHRLGKVAGFTTSIGLRGTS